MDETYWSVEDYNTCEEFEAALDQRDADRWEPSKGLPGRSWCFRGQSDSTWGLVPSAWRPDAVARFQKNDAFWLDTPGQRVAAGEVRLFDKFVASVDAAGLPVPGHLPAYSRLVRKNTDREEHWPAEGELFALALAQHYGVPTRMLDWTYSPWVAAYFAGLGSKASPPVGRIAVWAVNTSMFRAVDGGDEAGLLVTAAPAATNANLHAQQGLVLLKRGIVDTFDLAPAIEERTSRFKGMSRWDRQKPLRKLTLPTTQAPRLLARLHAIGVDELRLFPSLRSAAARVRRAFEGDQWR